MIPAVPSGLQQRLAAVRTRPRSFIFAIKHPIGIHGRRLCSARFVEFEPFGRALWTTLWLAYRCPPVEAQEAEAKWVRPSSPAVQCSGHRCPYDHATDWDGVSEGWVTALLLSHAATYYEVMARDAGFDEAQFYQGEADEFEQSARDLMRRAEALAHASALARETARLHMAAAADLRDRADRATGGFEQPSQDDSNGAPAYVNGAVAQGERAPDLVRATVNPVRSETWRAKALAVMLSEPDREWSVPEIVAACNAGTDADREPGPLDGARQAVKRMVRSGQVERTSRGRFRLTDVERGRSLSTVISTQS